MVEQSSSSSAAAMAADYPTIEPSTFDLVIYGTGLPCSLLAAAASFAGKSVLHLDPNPFYGSHFTSLSPDSLSSFLQSQPSQPPPASQPNYVPLHSRQLYSDVEITGEVPEASGSFLLDLSGPRVLYCADPLVDVMLRSGASHHVEFKSVDTNLLYWEGMLCGVPDSREAIFKDRSLGLTEKTQMMRFLKLVRGHVESQSSGSGEGMIAEEDLEMPFGEFLEKQRLPKKIRAIVLYAIAMADCDQENREGNKGVMKTKEGLENLALYSSSVGRLANAVGAFIYPVYGQGELPQAFCRCAAVKGALYVLRMAVKGLLTSEDTMQCKGVKLGSGQDISCHQLALDPSYTILSSLSPNFLQEGLEDTYQLKADNSSYSFLKVAKMICITRHAMQPDVWNALVVFPPRSLHPDQVTVVRALQLSSNVAVCPPGLYILYLSTLCDDSSQGKECIRVALKALCKSQDAESEESKNTGDVQECEASVLWSAFYVQDLTQANSFSPSLPLPDGNLDYRNSLKNSNELFQMMYPGEEFIPESAANDYIEENESSLD